MVRPNQLLNLTTRTYKLPTTAVIKNLANLVKKQKSTKHVHNLALTEETTVTSSRLSYCCALFRIQFNAHQVHVHWSHAQDYNCGRIFHHSISDENRDHQVR